jgi:deoxyribodipyrimidine photo-lyase
MLEQPVPDVLQASEPNEYICHYPESDFESLPVEKDLVLYTPWTLNPNFKRDNEAARILIIDTDWFDFLPVSERVMNFIVEQGRVVIPDLKVFVGSAAAALKDIDANRVSYRAHQTNIVWPGEGAEPARLVPSVTGYFPSFFKYWQKAQRGV